MVFVLHRVSFLRDSEPAACSVETVAIIFRVTLTPSWRKILRERERETPK